MTGSVLATLERALKATPYPSHVLYRTTDFHYSLTDTFPPIFAISLRNKTRPETKVMHMLSESARLENAMIDTQLESDK